MALSRREAIAALTALPGVARIQTANPSPTDVIVVEVDGHIPHDRAIQMEQTLSRVWPDRRIVVLADGMRLKMVPV